MQTREEVEAFFGNLKASALQAIAEGRPVHVGRKNDFSATFGPPPGDRTYLGCRYTISFDRPARVDAFAEAEASTPLGGIIDLGAVADGRNLPREFVESRHGM